MHGEIQQRHTKISGNFWRIMELPAMLIDMTYNDTPLSRSGRFRKGQIFGVRIHRTHPMQIGDSAHFCHISGSRLY